MKPVARAPRHRLAVALFFLSGLTSLVYEVLWTRRLTLTFGHTVPAVSTVVTAFMLGLAAGSLAAGRWVDARASHTSPAGFLRVYGLLEGFIGLWALLSLPLLGLVEQGYLALAGRWEGHGLLLISFLGAVLALTPPTLAMGATLPVLTRMLVLQPGELGSRLSWLYGSNTLGACAGAWLAGWWLLPLLGLRLSVWLGAVLNLGLLGAALLATRGEPAAGGIGPEQAAGGGRRGAAGSSAGGPDRAVASERATGDLSTASDEADEAAHGESPPDRGAASDPSGSVGGGGAGSGGWLLLAVFLAGAASLGYQLAWTRGLALCLGSSIYAFSATLCVFLAGLGLGGAAYHRIGLARRASAGVLAGLFVAVAGAGGVSLVALGWLPYVVIRLLPQASEHFWLVLALDLGLAALVLLPPTFLMGLSLPLASQLHAVRLGSLGRQIAAIYSANTAGCILGAALGGFVCIPMLGLQGSLKLAAGLYLLAGATPAPRRPAVWAAAGLCALGIVLVPPWNPGAMGGGAGVYASASHDPSGVANLRLFRQPAFYRDGLTSTVSVNVLGPGELNLRVNGKVDASLKESDLQTMLLTGYLPALLHRGPADAAVVGLGSGFTLRALANVPQIASIDCVELEPAVVEANRYFAPYNGHVLDDPRVHMHLTDGRTFILSSPRKFDILASEPSNPWIAGVGNLFTREFYQACRAHLKPGGVMCQWCNLYSLSPEDLQMVMRTFFEVFPHGMVWRSAYSDILMIGSEDPIEADPARVRQVWEGNPAIQRDFARIRLFYPEAVFGHYFTGRDAIVETFGPGPMNTDDRPLLEFSAPRSLYREYATEATLPQLVRARGPLPQLPPGVPASPANMVAAGHAWVNLGELDLVYNTLLPLREVPGCLLVAARAAQEQDKKETGALFVAALEAQPQEPLALWLTSLFLGTSARYEQALMLQSRLEAHPPPGLEERQLIVEADLLVRLKRLDDAAERLKRAATMGSGVSLPLTMLGQVQSRMERFADARNSFEQALALNPYDTTALVELARLDNSPGAVAAWRRLLELQPDNADHWLGLAGALKQQDPEGARKAYRQALRWDPANEAAKKALESP